MDRQDIDALLIGALYGELTPADEARLAAHLESHPADKSALDDLKSAREQVKQSRIFELQTEPPQAISAVLLQEAARRAPKKAAVDSGERESWFHRFVRSFASHPAMAAAAMLVLVVGIAGTIYMRNGSVGVDKTVDQSEETMAQNAPAQIPQPPATPAEPMAAKDQGAAAGSAAYQVDLADVDRKQAEGQQELEKADRARVAQAPATTTTTETAVAKTDEPKKPAAHASKKGTGYLEVETPQPAPKEMDSADDKIGDGEASNGIASQKQAGPGKFATAPAGNAAPGAAPSTGAVAGGGGAPAQQAAPPPQVAAAAPPPPPADYAKSKTAAVKSPAPAKTVAKPAPKAEEAPVEATRGDTDLIAWAKQQHAAAVAQVKAGNCSAAANLAVGVRSRAYGYYQQNMANDRELKGCASYIADAVNRDEERSSKPKAAKRASDEAPAPTSK